MISRLIKRIIGNMSDGDNRIRALANIVTVYEARQLMAWADGDL
jgi:hypothetical protein